MDSDAIVIDAANSLTERLSFKIPIISQLNGNRFGVRISVELTVEDSSGTGTIWRARVR